MIRKTKIFVVAAAVYATFAIYPAVAEKPADALAAEMESIQWTDVWISNVDKHDKPRVLLVGDSITKGYYEGVAKRLAGKAEVARFATSLCVADPAYEPTLRCVLSQMKFSVIHFNNGLHGFDFSEAQYRDGYEKALKTIRELQPQAKVVIVLSTPLRPESEKSHLNPRLDQRNEVAKRFAAGANMTVDDLYSLMKNHPEYYCDPYHYQLPAIQIQSAAVAAAILKAL
jgi:hypothetical protein